MAGAGKLTEPSGSQNRARSWGAPSSSVAKAASEMSGPARWARGRSPLTVAFSFVDQPPGSRCHWLLVENRDAEVCYTDPGGEPAGVRRGADPLLTGLAPRSAGLVARYADPGIVLRGDPVLAADLPNWNALEPHRDRPANP